MSELNTGTEPQGEKTVEKAVLKQEELDLVQGGCCPCSDPTQAPQETTERLERQKENEAAVEKNRAETIRVLNSLGKGFHD